MAKHPQFGKKSSKPPMKSASRPKMPPNTLRMAKTMPQSGKRGAC